MHDCTFNARHAHYYIYILWLCKFVMYHILFLSISNCFDEVKELNKFVVVVLEYIVMSLDMVRYLHI
jgi:hypothetical protein